MFQRIWRGLNYIEGYGDHPGLRPFCFLAAMGFCFCGWIGGGINMGFWLLVLCMGAYSRAKEAEKNVR
jgi:hypothetical protein